MPLLIIRFTMKKLLGLSLILLLNCNNNRINSEQFQMLNTYDLDIPDLSGLCFVEDNNSLYTISDSKKMAYRISVTGQIIEEYKLTCSDPEGICFIPDKNEFVVVDESDYTLYFYDTAFNKKYSKKLKIKNTIQNKGLEGICFNPHNNRIYLLNEKSPGLMIEYNPDTHDYKTIPISFSIDNTGIAFEPIENRFYVTSHESEQIVICNEQGRKIESFSMDITKLEGIALKPDQRHAYLVSDADKKLFVYKY